LLKEQLEEVLDTLTPREEKVLRLRFGLDDGRARTLEEVGQNFGVTRERIRQIEAKALRKLRHPSRSHKLKDFLDIIVRSGKPFVADADALGFLKSYGGRLTRTVATPHAGEFIRMFPELKAFPKTEQAIRAARELGCVVILKGADTVIAAPSGKAAINHETSFGLSTAGSGDVLSGITAAILAQGLPPFEAACAAVRLHSKAGIAAGERPVAEDIIAALRS
jgi:hydroxyethylthiazole kinase-like uncharacterized protein yjeF